MKRFFGAVWDHIEYILIIVLFVGVFYLAFAQGSYVKPGFNKKTEYVDKIFDRSYVHKIEVEISDENLTNLLNYPLDKNKYHSTVIIDGKRIDDVAFSVRGNGSIGSVFDNKNSERYNYTINFKKFNSHQTYYGLDKLALNGLYFEPSYLRSALAFAITSATGVDTSLYSFSELYINGEYRGLYLSVEAVDHSLLERNGASLDATLFHPVPYNIDADRIRQDQQYLAEGQKLDVDKHPDSSSNTHGGSDLVYRGNDPLHYNSIFMNATTKYSRADEQLVIDAIESLSEVSLKNPEDYWDINEVIRFFAASAFVYNDDSYLGGAAQNYYLKISNGKLSLIPWDFDRAFSENGFAPESGIEKNVISWHIDSLYYHGVSKNDRPLWRLVQDNPDYLQRYHDLLQYVLDNYILNGKCRNEYNELVDLIRPYVYADSTRTHTLEEFENEVEYLRNYILLRADSIQKQLWGIEPSTRKDK